MCSLCSAEFSQFLSECFFMEMSSKAEDLLTRDYNFIVVGGGIAGVTCVETVSFVLLNSAVVVLEKITL